MTDIPITARQIADEPLSRIFGYVLRRADLQYMAGVSSTGVVFWTRDKDRALRHTAAGADKLGRELWEDDRTKVKAFAYA